MKVQSSAIIVIDTIRKIYLPGRTLCLCISILFAGLSGCDRKNETASLPEMGDKYPDGLPNIVLILTDDQRVDTLFAMPTIEKLASQGVTFTNAQP